MSTDARTISFTCETCHKSFEVSAVYAGRKAVCNGCGKNLIVPSQSTVAASTREPNLNLDDLARLPGAEGTDASDFEYGENGTIYYAEPPRDLTDEEERAEEFSSDGPAPNPTKTAPSREGLLESTPRPPAGAEEDAETVLRLAIAKHLEWKQAIAVERERNDALQYVIEVEKREKLRLHQAAKSRLARVRAWRLRVLGILLLVYCGLAYMGFIGDWLVLSPSRDAIFVPLEKLRQIPTPGGGVLEMWTMRSPAMGTEEPEAYILALCGNDQRAENAASMALDRFIGHKVEVWSPNYPGFGGSSGRASLESAASSAQIAFDVLRNVAHGKPIILTGQNIGSELALSVAANNRAVAGLVLYDPAPLKDLMLWRYGWFNLWIVGGPVAWFAPKEFDTLQLARHGQAPAVFIIAGSDSLVPTRYQQMIIDAYAVDHRTINAANDGHDGLSSGPISRAATTWLFQSAAVSPKPTPATQPTTRPNLTTRQAP